MKNFPVISSILSAHHICFFVQEQYGLSKTTTCKLLKTGINHSYLVRDGDHKFVLRVYSLNWRTKDEIHEEIRLLTILQQKGIPVSYAIPDVKSNYIQHLNAPEGDRSAVLFSFAEGDKHLNFSADWHYNVGEVMARMHQSTAGLTLNRTTYDAQVLLTDSLEQLSKFLSVNSDEMAWMLLAQQHLLKEFAKADLAQIRNGAVHMDVWFDNMNITPNGDITLFDFDFCGNGWLCNDIAYYILQLHSTEKDEVEREIKKKSFFEGYESVTKINAEERRLLPLIGVAMYFFYLGIQCNRYDNWSNVFLNETYLKRFITLLVKKYFDDNVGSGLLTTQFN